MPNNYLFHRRPATLPAPNADSRVSASWRSAERRNVARNNSSALGKSGGLLRAVRQHKIIQAVTDADALHLLIRANIATDSMINFPLFHVVNFAQRLLTPAPVATAGKLFAVCLFGLRQFIPALQPSGAIAGLMCGPDAPVCVLIGGFVSGALAVSEMGSVWN